MKSSDLVWTHWRGIKGVLSVTTDQRMPGTDLEEKSTGEAVAPPQPGEGGGRGEWGGIKSAQLLY